MKTLQEMRKLFNDGKLKKLTVDDALNLKGRKIQTIYFGYAGQDGTDEFVVGNIVNQYDYYRLYEKGYKGKYKNMADEWSHTLSQNLIDDVKRRMVLLREDNSDTYIFAYDNEFFCSDLDRLVFYLESK